MLTTPYPSSNTGPVGARSYYSQDVAPAMRFAPQRQMIEGLAPYLRQGTNVASPLAGMSAAPQGQTGQPWYANQLAQMNEANRLSAAQRAEQLRQAELLRQQQAGAQALEQFMTDGSSGDGDGDGGDDGGDDGDGGEE